MASEETVPSDFNTLGLILYLQHDIRPAFITDTRPLTVTSDIASVSVQYANQAFERLRNSNPALALQGTQLVIDGSDINDNAFAHWIRNGRSDSYFDLFDIRWSITTLYQKWSIVSGITMSHRATPSDGVSVTSTVDTSRKYSGRVVDSKVAATPTGIFLPTILLPKGVAPSRHHRLVQTFNWASTPLGPIETWSAALRQTSSFVLNNNQACCLFWGQDRILLYNEAYVSLIKGLHPAAIGASAKIVFLPFWSIFEETFSQTERTGRAVRRENLRVILDRSGHLEEAFFTGTYIPILESNGTVGGILNVPLEVTKEVVAQRQLVTLLKIGEDTASKTSLHDLWRGFLKSIKASGLDVPMAVLYSTGKMAMSMDSSSNALPSASADEDLFLEGYIGFPEHHSTIPAVLKKSSQVGFAPAIRLAASGSGILHVGKDSPVFAPDILQNFQHPDAGNGLSQFVVAPIQLSSKQVSAWLVLGINPLRQYDGEYQRFLNILSRQVESAATSVFLLERERQRLQKTKEDAEKEQRWLSEQLAQQIREAQESELRFLNFAKQAPVGVYIFGPSGEVKFSNDAWRRMVGISDASDEAKPWRGHVHPDDLDEMDRQWQSLVEGHPQTNFEWRAVLPHARASSNEPEVRYLRSSCFPELEHDGTMKTVTGVLMDITVQKAHERATAERLKDALEAKRAQENFMDMVSHEMRNPLNAILQCAEEARQLLASLAHEGPHPPERRQTIILEAIDTILYCGQHQKQIIDDVLTISKLDSDLLTLYPTETKPFEIVEQACKIFASEIRAADIQVFHSLIASAREDIVTIDPGRVLQILINLIGNAIKFLKGRPTRKLTVTVETSSTRPASIEVKYVPSGRQRDNSAPLIDPTGGEVTYVYFSVTDTGPGLTVEEMSNLFARFKQGSPRTHAQYGGSGLGLFISRQLTELHGGEIGFHSEINQGSTFAFYISGKRVRQRDMLSRPTLRSPPVNWALQDTNNDMKNSVETSVVLFPAKSQKYSTADPTILIVEDNLVNQKVLSRQLRNEGLVNVTTNHGKEALAAIRRSSWWLGNRDSNDIHLSIVLCDLEMPVMDGMTCIRHIRNWQREGLLSPRIPAIAITGNARSEQINAAKEAGFDYVICKPYSVAELVPLIKKLVVTSY